jgi:UDP-N-acetylglucosamine 3-dehydrogenase
VPKLKAAVIGAGAIAQHCHLPGYQNHPDVDLVAIAEIDADRAAQAARKFGAKRTYADFREMLAKEQLDMVSVCTPNYLHCQMATTVARLGIHLMLEKPVATSVAQALKIRQAVRKGAGQCMVGFTHRFLDGNILARQMVKEGKIGEPFMIRVRFAHRGPQPGWAMSDWFYRRKKSGGGAMLDMGIHAMDLSRFLVGEVDSVFGLVGTLRKEIEVDDNAVVGLKFAGNRAMGYIEVGWTSGPGFTGVEIYGDEGALLVDYGRGMELIQGSVAPDGAVQDSRRMLEVQVTAGGWVREMETFINCIRDGVPTPITIDDGVAATAIAEAISQSAETGQMTKVATD